LLGILLAVANHTNYELDENLIKLGAIRLIEKERNNQALWSGLREEERIPGLREQQKQL